MPKAGRKLARRTERLAGGAHLVSNQRPGDPLIIACACTYGSTGNAAMTVVRPGEALECWVCSQPLCDDCKRRVARAAN